MTVLFAAHGSSMFLFPTLPGLCMGGPCCFCLSQVCFPAWFCCPVYCHCLSIRRWIASPRVLHCYINIDLTITNVYYFVIMFTTIESLLANTNLPPKNNKLTWFKTMPFPPELWINMSNHDKRAVVFDTAGWYTPCQQTGSCPAPLSWLC